MEFEHVANALCLELANSVPDRREAERAAASIGAAASTPRDWLDADTADAWIASLSLDARPSDEAARRHLRELRAAIFDAFTALAAGSPPPAAALERITREHARGLERFGYTATDAGVRRDWPEPRTADALAAAFAESAVAELTGDRLDRLKACPNCGWLFIDTSKNRSRRWCSMQMCGARDKSLRHYRKQRAAAGAPAPGRPTASAHGTPGSRT